VAKYVLDTGLYVHATRNDQWNEQLQSFNWSFAPFLYLHSVVAGELLAGALSPALERLTRQRFIEPFEDTGRVVAPGHEAWKRAGEVVANLVRKKKLSPNGVPRSFLNDCLIAASAREHGLVVVTENLRDFELIKSIIPFEVASPWPEPVRLTRS
jgi:predicted nucleic acid-binding protein